MIMSLEILINNDIKKAMLNRDKQRLESLRAIKSALLMEKTGVGIGGAEIPKEVELKVLQKLVKQRKESAEIYKSQGRDDLAEVELFQSEIIENYLPEQLSEDEIKALIQNIITEAGASTMKDMGKVMGITSKQLAGKADNRTVSTIIKNLLNN